MRVDFYVLGKMFLRWNQWPNAIPKEGSQVTFEGRTDNLTSPTILITGKVNREPDYNGENGKAHINVSVDIGEFTKNVLEGHIRVTRWTRVKN